MKWRGAGLGALVGAAGMGGPAFAAPALSAYGQLPAMENVQLSPGGGRYAYDGAAGDKRYVVVRSAEDGKVLQTVGTDKHKIRALRWADDDHLLIVMTGAYDFGGDAKYELPAVMLVNLKRHSLKQLAPSEDDLRGEPIAVTQEGGHPYGYFESGATATKRVDLDTGQVVTAFTAPPHTDELAVSPQGKVVARLETTDYGRSWRVMAGLDSQKVLAQGRSEHGDPALVAFGRTPDSVLFRKPEDDDFENFREMSLKDGALSDPLVQGAHGSPMQDRRSRLTIGFRIDGREPREVFLDPDLDAKWASVRAAFPKERVTPESFDDGHNRGIVHVDGDHDSGRFFLIDLKSKQAILLGADYPDVKADDVASARWFDYAAQDGTRLTGVLTVPPGRDPRMLPVVVMPHGGPAAHDTVHFDWWAQAIASRGYAVFQPNFRGSDGYGRKFERAGWGQWGKLMQTDVSDGLRALEAKGLVDPKRACIVGWSYGGYATLAGVTLQNGLYRCAAAGGAVSDLAGMLNYEYAHAGGEKSPVMRYWKASMALKGAGDPAASAASPAMMAARADAPLLLIHGKDDTVVPFSQAQTMVDAMHRAGKPVELTVLPGEDHWLSSGDTRTRMLEAMVGFLAKHNPPDAGSTRQAEAAPPVASGAVAR